MLHTESLPKGSYFEGGAQEEHCEYGDQVGGYFSFATLLSVVSSRYHCVLGLSYDIWPGRPPEIDLSSIVEYYWRAPHCAEGY